MKGHKVILDGIPTLSSGSPWFGIKPYPILVTYIYKHALTGEIQLFTVFTRFKQVAQGWEIELDSEYTFNPVAVQITPSLKEYIIQQGAHLPTYLLNSTEKSVNEIRRRSSVMENDKSECPGFKKHWDPEVTECKDCAKTFADEYMICKRAVLEKQESLTVPTTTTTAATATVEKKDVAGAHTCFRPGSRAAVLADFLKVGKTVTVDVAIQYLVEHCHIEQKTAADTVKGYMYEWKKGLWGGKSLPFMVVVNGDCLVYQTK
jgi:hypothetical protein